MNSSPTNLLSGKLLLQQELPFSEKEIQSFIHTGVLQEVPGIKEHIFGFVCIRCGNQKSHLFGAIPRDDEEIVYCRKCIEMGRVSTCEPLYRWTGAKLQMPQATEALKWKGKLTQFQQDAANQIETAMLNRARLLVWAVCGAGKTEMLFQGLAAAMGRGDRICLATPRADVVRELEPRFREAFPNITISALYGGSPDRDEGSPFVLSTTHQLLRYEKAFDVMIIDEVDAFPYHADQSLSYAAKRARKDQSSLIFLTATPRTKLKLQSNLNLIPTVFVPARYHGHPLPVPRFVPCYNLKKSLKKETLPSKITNWIAEKRNANRRFLLFASSIAAAEKIAKLTGMECVHASDPERVEKVERYRNQEMDALITTTILERGVTFPSIDVAVIEADHQVFDEAALVQIAGRAGRNAKDPYGDVVFFHQGKTNGMVGAKRMIEMMNDLAKRR
nr:DEAD/DEAH box helicase [Salirhabdus sp. Marseille-P4669]